MKRFKLLAISLLAITGLSLAGVGAVHAQHFTTSVGSKRTVNSSVYAFGRAVNIDGTVNGDVFCAGQDVVINGTVHGDVLCAAVNLTVKGTVDGSIRVAGRDTVVDAKISRAATIAASHVAVKDNTSIGQDMTVIGDGSIAGSVGRDLVVTGADVQVGGVVGRNLRFGGSQLTLTDGAKVNGGITYTSDQAMRTEGETKVAGRTIHELPKKQERKSAHVFGRTPASIIYIVSSFVVLCMVLVWFVPQQLHAVSEVAVKRLGTAFMVGFVSIFGFMFVAFMLAVSVVGIPLAIVVILAGLLTVMLSGPVSAYYFGSMLRSRSTNPLVIMITGSLVLGVAFVLPVIGALAIFASYLIGSGSLLLSLKQHMPKPTYKV